jgi:exosome complex component CSL4
MIDGAGEESDEVVTPGEFLGEATQFIAGKGAYVSPNGRSLRASLTGRRKITPPPSGSSDNVSAPFTSLSFWSLRSRVY